MTTIKLIFPALALLAAQATPATAQSNPAGFTTVVNIPGDQPSIVPFSGIGSDTQINLADGGSIGSFFTAGPFDNGANIEVNVSGGSIGSFFDANSGSTINISGGSIDTSFDANSGSTVNISGGSVRSSFNANSGSTVNISGGFGGESFDANSGSTVNISGGSFGDFFQAFSGSTVNLFGTFFLLDGVELSGLVANEPFVIDDRDVTLTGLLADGSAFDFGLDSVFNAFGNGDIFASDATLTVTLVPEPTAATLLALAGVGASLRRRRRA